MNEILRSYKVITKPEYDRLSAVDKAHYQQAWEVKGASKAEINVDPNVWRDVICSVDDNEIDVLKRQHPNCEYRFIGYKLAHFPATNTFKAEIEPAHLSKDYKQISRSQVIDLIDRFVSKDTKHELIDEINKL